MDVYWCDRCSVPTLDTECGICGSVGRRIASDIRPVFPQEKRLLEVLLELPKGSLMRKSVWDTNSNNIYLDGESVTLNKGNIMQREPFDVRGRLSEYTIADGDAAIFGESAQKFVQANKQRLNAIELEAFDIIREAGAGRQRHIPLVSFSGGKDSTVVSDLVRRAFANQSIIHMFGNTTLELPETLAYVQRFKAEHNKTPFLESKSRHDFLDLCNKIGPPSRVMRWCCTVFKTGPISQVFEGMAKNKPILTFYGVRRSESTRRASYQAIAESPKVSKQTVVSPIINWSDADVWLYILSRGLDFNDAYRLGFSRVGCWACPSNSMWSFYLSRIYHAELAEPWRDYLMEVAATMGKPDPEEYVDSGNWKKRQGGQGLRTAYKGIATSRPCGDDPDAKTYTLTKPISEDLYEYFKPFGHVDLSRGRSLLGEVFVVDARTKDPMLVLQGRIGTAELRVKIVNSNNPTLFMHRIDCQIRKYQSCVLCGGCPPICPAGAISDKTGRYVINEEKCVHCLKCVSHYDTGCLVSKVLKTKRGTVR